MASRTGPDPDDHVHSAAAVAGEATVVLSAERTRPATPPADIAPARRRNPDVFLAELLRRYPQDVIGVVDAMGAALREPLTREQVLARFAAAGAPRFAAEAAGTV